MITLIFYSSFWVANACPEQQQPIRSSLQVKCQSHCSNKIKMKFKKFLSSTVSSQKLFLKKNSSPENKMTEERTIFLVSKYMENCSVIRFCHLIMRNKGCLLFQFYICIYNSMLPWRNLIILDFFDGNTSL